MDIEIIKTVILTVGFILAFLQLCLVYKKMHDQHEWNRRNNALKFSFSDDPNMIEILQRLDQHFNIGSEIPRTIKLSEIEEKLQNDADGNCIYPTVRNDIHFALARLETMCIAMKHNVADPEICEDMLRTRIISLHRAFKDYIEQARDLRGSQLVFRNLQDYADSWGKTDSIKAKNATGKI